MVRRVRADRERQSMAIDNRHDFMPFPRFRSSDFQPATLGHNEGCVDVLLRPVRLYREARWRHPSARDAKPHRGTKSESADAQFCSSGSSAATENGWLKVHQIFVYCATLPRPKSTSISIAENLR
jgi:hypothetical protein